MAGPSRRLGLRLALQLNDMLFKAAQALGLPYWSLSAWLKHKVKNAVEYISPFRGGGGARSRKRAASTAWSAAISTMPRSARSADVLYLNDGDWVESCTALVEDARGNMEILRWAVILFSQKRRRAPARFRQPAPRLYPRRKRGGLSRGLIRPAWPRTGQIKVLIVTDAWAPQVNGVVRTLEMLGQRSDRAWAMRCATRRRKAASPCRCRPIPRSGWRCFPRRDAGKADPRIRARRDAHRDRRHAGTYRRAPSA